MILPRYKQTVMETFWNRYFRSEKLTGYWCGCSS